MMFDELGLRAAETLATLAAATRGCAPRWQGLFQVTQPMLDPMQAEARNQLLVDIAAACPAGARSIYFFRVGEAAELTAIKEAFTAGRAGSNRKFARLNGGESRYLYVGSSKTLSTRTREHLGFGRSAETYAMQLAHWTPGLVDAIEVVCARYDQGTPDACIQALEDTLWSELKPMFGRRGTR